MLALILIGAIAFPSQDKSRNQDFGPTQSATRTGFPRQELEITVVDVARLPANDILVSWRRWADEAFATSDALTRIEELPSLLSWACASHHHGLKRALSLIRHLQGARDERVGEEDRIEDLRWLRGHYPDYWSTGIWPVPLPKPTLADVTRLPSLKLITSWQKHSSAAFAFCHEWSREKRVPSDKPLPSVFRWAIHCYEDELRCVWPIVGHMQDPRNERMDANTRIQNLIWLRDHYPNCWKTSVWLVPPALDRFRDSRTKEPPPFFRTGPNGEMLPPERRVHTKDS